MVCQSYSAPTVLSVAPHRGISNLEHRLFQFANRLGPGKTVDSALCYRPVMYFSLRAQKKTRLVDLPTKKSIRRKLP
jgi:hypothetical protein